MNARWLGIPLVIVLNPKLSSRKRIQNICRYIYTPSNQKHFFVPLFIKLFPFQHWLNCYRYYRGYDWYFNAGGFPSYFPIVDDVLILTKVDHYTFGQRIYDDAVLYNSNDNKWMNYLTFHLWKTIGVKDRYDKENPLYQQNLLDVDENIVKSLNTSFGQMCRFILYNTTDLIL